MTSLGTLAGLLAAACVVGGYIASGKVEAAEKTIAAQDKWIEALRADIQAMKDSLPELQRQGIKLANADVAAKVRESIESAMLTANDRLAKIEGHFAADNGVVARLAQLERRWTDDGPGSLLAETKALRAALQDAPTRDEIAAFTRAGERLVNHRIAMESIIDARGRRSHFVNLANQVMKFRSFDNVFIVNYEALTEDTINSTGAQNSAAPSWRTIDAVSFDQPQQSRTQENLETLVAALKSAEDGVQEARVRSVGAAADLTLHQSILAEIRSYESELAKYRRALREIASKARLTLSNW